MPINGNLDPKTLQKAFENQNNDYKGLNWELKDLLPDHFFDALVDEYPNAVVRTTRIADKVHRDLSPDGKARLHRLVKAYASKDYLAAVINVLRALRFYMALPPAAVARVGGR
jgi:hypothetical protein